MGDDFKWENFQPPPGPINGIERKKWLKLLGVTFEDDVCCWELQVDDLLSRAGSRMYILRVCKRYGYQKEHLQAHLHDATSRMWLSFWRMKTTADAIISVDQLTAKFKMWQLYTQLLEYISQGKNRIRLVASCRWALGYLFDTIILSLFCTVLKFGAHPYKRNT